MRTLAAAGLIGLLTVTGICWSSSASAQQMYRCRDAAGKTTYQQQPCESSAKGADVVTGATVKPQPSTTVGDDVAKREARRKMIEQSRVDAEKRRLHELEARRCRQAIGFDRGVRCFRELACTERAQAASAAGSTAPFDMMACICEQPATGMRIYLPECIK